VVTNPGAKKGEAYDYPHTTDQPYVVASGLGIGGAINGACRDPQDLVNSNTYHRSATVIGGVGVTYTVHMYAQYFQKDQVSEGGGSAGHTHDMEYVSVWLMDGELFAVIVSSHGNTVLWAGGDKNQLAFQENHVRVVFQRLGEYLPAVNTHHFRPAKKGEGASNHEKRFLVPSKEFMPLVSWPLMPQALRDRFNTEDFGTAKAPFNNVHFYEEINNKQRPSEFPLFIPE
jgi:hypothetical protein